MSNLRFSQPITTPCPRGARMVEAYSLKLGRRVQCFGEPAYRQWIRLEANPEVEAFCERPVMVEWTDGSKCPADFWVRHAGCEELIVIGDTIDAAAIPARVGELPIRAVTPAEMAAARIWVENWMAMLPSLISCRDYLPKSLLRAVLKSVSKPRTLGSIESEHGLGDPTLVRAAVYGLLHAGELRAPQLHTELLSFLTRFEPSGAQT